MELGVAFRRMQLIVGRIDLLEKQINKLKMEHTVALTNHQLGLLFSVAYLKDLTLTSQATKSSKYVKFNVHYLVDSAYPFGEVGSVFEKKKSEDDEMFEEEKWSRCWSDDLVAGQDCCPQVKKCIRLLNKNKTILKGFE